MGPVQVVTPSSFSKGAKEAALFPGAAPITLIDGDRLITLMVENSVGVRHQSATLHEVDEPFFEQPDIVDQELGDEMPG